jgi:hypothetical protein
MLKTVTPIGKQCWIYFTESSLDISDALLYFNGLILSNVVWDEGTRVFSFSVESWYNDTLELGYTLQEDDIIEMTEEHVGAFVPVGFGTPQKVPGVLVSTQHVARASNHRGEYKATGTDNITQNTRFLKFDTDKLPQSGSTGFRQSFDIEVYADDTSSRRVLMRGYINKDIFEVCKEPNTNTYQVNMSLFTNLEIIARDSSDTDYNNPRVAWVDSYTDYVGCYMLYQRSGSTKRWINVVDGQEGNKLIFKYDFWEIVNSNNFTGETFLPGSLLVGEKFTWGSYVKQGSWQTGGTLVDLTTQTRNTRSGIVVGVSTPISTEFDTFDLGPNRIVKFLTATKDVYLFNVGDVTGIKVFGERSGTNGTYVEQMHEGDWFAKTYTVNNIKISAIQFNTPVKMLRDKKYTGQVFVTFRAGSSNTAIQISTLISTYLTNLSVDTSSFNSVAELLVDYPSDFAIFSPMNVFDLCREMARQARCALIVRGSTVYIKALFAAPTVENMPSITVDNIISGTLQLGYTSIDDVLTHLKGTWYSDYTGYVTAKHIAECRNNIKLLGDLVSEQDYFIYSQEDCVVTSLAFWAGQRSTVYKTVSFSTTLNKVALDVFDKFQFHVKLFGGVVVAEVKSINLNLDSCELHVEADLDVKVDIYVDPGPGPGPGGTIIDPVPPPEPEKTYDMNTDILITNVRAYVHLENATLDDLRNEINAVTIKPWVRYFNSVVVWNGVPYTFNPAYIYNRNRLEPQNATYDYGRGEHRNELVWADEIGRLYGTPWISNLIDYTKPDHEQDVNEHGGSLRNTRISIAGYQGLKNEDGANLEYYEADGDWSVGKLILATDATEAFWRSVYLYSTEELVEDGYYDEYWNESKLPRVTEAGVSTEQHQYWTNVNEWSSFLMWAVLAYCRYDVVPVAHGLYQPASTPVADYMRALSSGYDALSGNTAKKPDAKNLSYRRVSRLGVRFRTPGEYRTLEIRFKVSNATYVDDMTVLYSYEDPVLWSDILSYTDKLEINPDHPSVIVPTALLTGNTPLYIWFINGFDYEDTLSSARNMAFYDFEIYCDGQKIILDPIVPETPRTETEDLSGDTMLVYNVTSNLIPAYSPVELYDYYEPNHENPLGGWGVYLPRKTNQIPYFAGDETRVCRIWILGETALPAHTWGTAYNPAKLACTVNKYETSDVVVGTPLGTVALQSYMNLGNFFKVDELISDTLCKVRLDPDLIWVDNRKDMPKPGDQIWVYNNLESTGITLQAHSVWGRKGAPVLLGDRETYGYYPSGTPRNATADEIFVVGDRPIPINNLGRAWIVGYASLNTDTKVLWGDDFYALVKPGMACGVDPVCHAMRIGDGKPLTGFIITENLGGGYVMVERKDAKSENKAIDIATPKTISADGVLPISGLVIDGENIIVAKKSCLTGVTKISVSSGSTPVPVRLDYYDDYKESVTLQNVTLHNSLNVGQYENDHDDDALYLYLDTTQITTDTITVHFESNYKTVDLIINYTDAVTKLDFRDPAYCNNLNLLCKISLDIYSIPDNVNTTILLGVPWLSTSTKRKVGGVVQVTSETCYWRKVYYENTGLAFKYQKYDSGWGALLSSDIDDGEEQPYEDVTSDFYKDRAVSYNNGYSFLNWMLNYI